MESLHPYQKHYVFGRFCACWIAVMYFGSCCYFKMFVIIMQSGTWIFSQTLTGLPFLKFQLVIWNYRNSWYCCICSLQYVFSLYLSTLQMQENCEHIIWVLLLKETSILSDFPLGFQFILRSNVRLMVSKNSKYLAYTCHRYPPVEDT